MAYILEPYQGTDDKMQVTSSGINFFANGGTYIQYGDSTSIANSTTQTSLYTKSGSTATTPTITDFGPLYPSDGSTLTVGANCHTLGTVWQGRIVGLYSTTSTPTLQIDIGFINAASTFASKVNTGAITMPSSVTNMDFELVYDVIIKSITTSTSNVLIRATWTYGSSATAQSFYKIVSTLVSLDLTQNQTFDVRATWGTASASNTITTKYATMEVIG